MANELIKPINFTTVIGSQQQQKRIFKSWHKTSLIKNHQEQVIQRKESASLKQQKQTNQNLKAKAIIAVNSYRIYQNERTAWIGYAELPPVEIKNDIPNGNWIRDFQDEERKLQSIKTKTHLCFMSYRIKKVSHRLKGDDVHLQTAEAVSNLLGAL